jgi:hypothetical protein
VLCLLCSKEDLDVALSAAFSSKDSVAQADTRAKAQRARGELQAAEGEVGGWAGRQRVPGNGRCPGSFEQQTPAQGCYPAAPPRSSALQVAAAGSDRERSAARRKADQAAQRLQKYEQRLAEAAAKQVGTCPHACKEERGAVFQYGCLALSAWVLIPQRYVC